MTTTVELAEVQSNVLRGYRVLEALPRQRYVYVTFDGAASGRAWLKAVLPHVTSCERFDAAEGPFALNVALSHTGLRRLEAPIGDDELPEAFVQGMAKRAKRLGDVGESAPERWHGGLGQLKVDALVSIGGSDDASIQAGQRVLDAAASPGVESIHVENGAAFADRPRGTEPFGFVDGIGQPFVEGCGLDPWPGEGTPEAHEDWAPIKAGEFVLGYPNEGGSSADPVPVFLKNSSYLVLRKLEQQVAAFRRYVAEIGELAGESPELIAAKMVGRWPSGAPLELSPERDDPELGADPARNNDFRYKHDAEGHRCPFGAHIRRANPRDDPTGPTILQVKQHRIIRRAIPYGTWLPEGGADDGTRGTLFGVINSDIANQFEYVQLNWMNGTISSRALSMPGDKDPLIGANDGAGKLWIPRREAPIFCWDLPRFTLVRGGGYFLLPSMTALKTLAG